MTTTILIIGPIILWLPVVAIRLMSLLYKNGVKVRKAVTDSKQNKDAATCQGYFLLCCQKILTVCLVKDCMITIESYYFIKLVPVMLARSEEHTSELQSLA